MPKVPGGMTDMNGETKKQEKKKKEEEDEDDDEDSDDGPTENLMAPGKKISI